ncbi:hypothetical protein ASG52_15850 [Methylobacterium sp. Leaf456]|uniref:HVO_A0114 family putative DNA-binding protein n=1 Tax=Methylobacterium sp. Leaf456 TaxID=1736382 RepID=UPI0006F9BC30|nr:hypothetical protein [Methylobacterium sp. Leaf456]KQT45619.1 hypothetical protein ASG52_15850 [Methylobacterium sp. Leaf456]
MASGRTIETEVGRDLRAVAADVAEARKAAQDGQAVAGDGRIVVRDRSALYAVMTPKRSELLRHLRRTPESGVRAPARALNRDVRRVHEDVTTLAELGLVLRGEGGRLSREIDAITSTIRIAA